MKGLWLRIGKLEMFTEPNLDLEELSKDPCAFNGSFLGFSLSIWNVSAHAELVLVKTNESFCQKYDHRLLVLKPSSYYGARGSCEQYGFALATEVLISTFDLGKKYIVQKGLLGQTIFSS